MYRSGRRFLYCLLLCVFISLCLNGYTFLLLAHQNRNMKEALPMCPVTYEELGLRGEIVANMTLPFWTELENKYGDVPMGGSWSPKDCQPRHNVAIIVPYRDREVQLLLFLQHLHPFLRKQKLAYTIYVLEQAPGKVFNRGLVRNIGFKHAMKINPRHECAMFHDVDLLPLDDRNMYNCPEQPRHVCTGVNYINNFMPLYNNSFAEFGHVVSFRKDHFRIVNGYSNLYLGWGAEDDDLHSRVKSKGMKVFRYPDKLSRYYGIPHMDESQLPRPDSMAKDVNRFKLLRIADRRMHRDGLNNLKYNIISKTKEKLFTRIVFDVDEEKYAKEAIAAESLYHQLYGQLSPYWKKNGFIPQPYWWKHL